MHLWLYVIVTFVLFQLTAVSGEDKNRSQLEKEILQKIFLGSKFHMYVRPHKAVNRSADEPLEVLVSLYVLNLDINERKQECSITMYFRQEWNDSRLSYENNKVNVLPIHDTVGFWIPDLFFTNEKLGHLHSLTKPNIFVKIYPEGRVIYSQRVTVNLACPMDLRKYPFDTQICALPIESYGFTANDIMIKWKPDFTPGLTQPPGYKVFYSTSEEIVHFVQNYSRIELGIHFSRIMSPQLFHVFIPLGFFVISSWISFYLRASDQILRLTTTAMSVFATSMCIHSTKEFIHPMTYLTGLDIWVGVSCLLIFAAVLENIYVIASHGNKRNETGKKKDVLELSCGEKDKWKLVDLLARKLSAEGGEAYVDVLSRMTFPFVFLLFIVIYLAYYLI